MYNGYNGNEPKFRSIGRSNIPPLYLYIGIGVLVLLGLWLVSGFLRASIESYFALVTGVLLVLGNLRDVIISPYQQRSNVPLVNSLLGGGLIFYFLGNGGFPPLGGLWYVAAVLMVVLAAPLMLGRATVYTAYLETARNVGNGVRQAVTTLIQTK